MEPTARFVEEFARHQQRLFAYVYSLLPRRADAEDVFQRTSVLLWQKAAAWDPAAPFLSWACGVAFYEVKNFLRVSGRDRLRFGDGLLDVLARERVEQMPRRDERLAALEDCLKGLDRPERELVRRAYGGETAIREIARENGQAAQTVYNRLNAIRRKLFDCAETKAAGAGA